MFERWSGSAHAGRYCDTPLTDPSTFQFPPRHCLSDTESITMSVLTSSREPATLNFTEQSFVV